MNNRPAETSPGLITPPPMPDLNSLPPSQTPSSRSSPTSHHRPSLSPQIPSPLSRSPTSTAPAGPPQTGSPRIPRSPHIERRRSSLLRDWSLNDAGTHASSPGGEPQPHPPHHQRAPSLGELHQELENEQEAQVNRLLAMIRHQQAQIQQSQSQLQAQQQQPQQQAPHDASATHGAPVAAASTTAIASSTPGSSCPPSAGHSRPQSQSQTAQQLQAVPGNMPPPTASASSLSRQSSSSAPRGRARTNSHSQYSHASSPSSRPHEGPDWSLPGMGGGAGRDEVAFYQAETAMMQRENQMLKGRIRELERLVQGMRAGAGGDDASAA